MYDSGEGEHLTFADGQWTVPPEPEDRVPPRRWRRIWLLLVVVMVLAAMALLYVTTPPPTVLAVRVVDHETGAALAGAQVIARPRGQNPLPAVTTGEDGVARFELLDDQGGYSVQVQKVDYDLMSVNSVIVADAQETVLPVWLVHNPGGRLFVGLEGARVVQMDVASLGHIQTIVLPAAPQAPVRHLRLHPTQDLLYVVAGAEGQILSSSTGATLARFDVEASSIDGLEVSADGRYVLATGAVKFDPTDYDQHHHLWFIDAQSGALVTDTLLSQADSRIEVAWQPDGMATQILLATHSVMDRVPPSNATLGNRLGTIAFMLTDYPDWVNLSRDGEYLYTWMPNLYSPEQDAFLDLLMLISSEDGTAVYQHVSPGVAALATAPGGESLFVLNEDLGTLAIIDLVTDGQQVLVPVGKRPVALTVSWDGERVYVADRGGVSVVVVDVAPARVIATIPLSAEPLSLAVR
ncbi:MAG: carboxypeptidase regulatory-like domain-containing protein [Anaerolineae bacterium]|nr:carboxypeptidase regulatory-like domain-containing protein [Anaerolineae bacterium]